MYANVIEVLDLSVAEGKVTCCVERCSVTDQPNARIMLSWNDTAARDGFQLVGGGVAFVHVPDRMRAEPTTAAPDDLGDGRFAWRDTAHVGNMIVVVVLPPDSVVKELRDTHPSPVRFKAFNGRMAFYWDIGDKTTDVTWRVVKRGNRKLDKLVAELNRAAIAAKPVEHALVVDKPSEAGAQPLTGHSDPNGYRPTTWEKVTVAVLAAVIILAVLFSALQKDEIPARNFILLRILLSAAMGFMGGVIPGFLGVDLSLRGVLIRSGGGLALGVIAFFFTPSVVPNDPPKQAQGQPPQAQEQPKTSSLLLRIENSSSADDTAPARKPAIQEPKFGVAQRIEFSLANPTSGLAMIDEMAIEILDVVEDKTGSTQALVVHYKYPVDLTPAKGSVSFGEKFKYAPGDVDRFSVGAGATNGYDYFVRIVVRWFDAVSSEKRVTVSEPLVLCFPAPFPLNTPTTVREELQKQQRSRIEERLRQLSGN